MKTYISEKCLVVDEEGRLRGGQACRGEEEVVQGEDCAWKEGSVEIFSSRHFHNIPTYIARHCGGGAWDHGFPWSN